jgi:ferredoxin, 2Fe-2S
MGLLRVIDRDGVEHEVQGTYGQKIMEILRELDYGVTAICGGLCACATCHVHVDSEWWGKLPPRQSDETDLVSGTEEYVAGASRLSCQVEFTQALNGIRVRIVSDE